MNRAIMQQLAEMRLEDARVLLENKRYAGAYYLAGYAVECALKACIAKQTRQYDFPPERKKVEKIYSHKLGELASLAGIPIEEKCKTDCDFQRYWQLLVANWSEQSRYERQPPKPVEDLFVAIRDPEHGVFQWLQRFW